MIFTGQYKSNVPLLSQIKEIHKSGEIIVILWNDWQEIIMRANLLKKKHIKAYVMHRRLRTTTDEEKQFWYETCEDKVDEDNKLFSLNNIHEWRKSKIV